MPWFTIMTVIVVILAVFGLIALAKYLVNYSKKRPLNNIYERICLNRRQILLVYVLRNYHIDDWIPNLVGFFQNIVPRETLSFLQAQYSSII